MDPNQKNRRGIGYSIVETAKANGLEPYDYLLMILSLLPSKGKSPSHETLERLMPWHPDVQGREVLRRKKNWSKTNGRPNFNRACRIFKDGGLLSAYPWTPCESLLSGQWGEDAGGWPQPMWSSFRKPSSVPAKRSSQPNLTLPHKTPQKVHKSEN